MKKYELIEHVDLNNCTTYSEVVEHKSGTYYEVDEVDDLIQQYDVTIERLVERILKFSTIHKEILDDNLFDGLENVYFIKQKQMDKINKILGE